MSQGKFFLDLSDNSGVTAGCPRRASRAAVLELVRLGAVPGTGRVFLRTVVVPQAEQEMQKDELLGSPHYICQVTILDPTTGKSSFWRTPMKIEP
jgi:hypothetical protein